MPQRQVFARRTKIVCTIGPASSSSTLIERGLAISHIEEILLTGDGIMVARGDLGVDIPLEQLPMVQKDIIRRCNKLDQPVITATQMLESMVTAARPTRAEVTDVANAIFDGTDAVMLSAETSIGKYPVQAVAMMAKIASTTDSQLPHEQVLQERGMALGRRSMPPSAMMPVARHTNWVPGPSWLSHTREALPDGARRVARRCQSWRLPPARWFPGGCSSVGGSRFVRLWNHRRSKPCLPSALSSPSA